MIVAVANQKGGVGKTTTAVNLAAYISLQKRALLVDMDPQANATIALGLDENSVDCSVYEVLIGNAPLEEALATTHHGNLHLVPATRRLAGAEVEIVAMEGREALLKNALQSALERFDTVIVDCPPSLGLLTVNALTAADAVLIPVQCEYLALEGLGQLMHTIELVQRNLNPRLSILGLVLTMHDSRTNLSNQVVDEVRSHFPNLAFDTVVSRNIRLTEAPSFGKTILEYDPTSRGALAYAALTREVLGRM